MKKNKVLVKCYSCEEMVPYDYCLKEDYKYICFDCLYDKKEESK